MLLTYIRAFFGERNMVAGPSHNNFIFRIVKCAVIYSKTIIKSAIPENVKIVGANVTQKLRVEDDAMRLPTGSLINFQI